MRKLLFISIFPALVIAFTGCYKDKGNYIYSNINQITINASSDTVNVLLPDSIRVNVTLSQSMPDAAGLKYEWVIYPNTQAPLTRRTLDTTQNLKAALGIGEPPGSYLMDYFVTDRKTNVLFRRKFVVNVLSVYSEGWIVAEETAGGTDLSMITPVDVVYRNVYSGANSGQKLPPGVFRIPEIKTNRNVQSVYALSPTEMIQPNSADFLKIGAFNDFFWQAPVAKPQEYFMNGDAEMMMNSGKPYSRNLINGGVNKLNLPPPGNYYMAPFEMYTVASGYVLFDTISQKFFKLDLNTITLVPFNTAGSTLFELNNINKRLFYAEINTGNQINAIFKNNNNDSLFAFVFNPTVAIPAVSRYDGLTAPGLLTAKIFVGSRTLPYFYYASGNQVYKLDILAKTATSIYTFPAGTEIRAMKMYRNLKVSTDANNNKLIAVATKESGEGKVYYFPIATTGSFTGNTYSKVFTGFGQINEITFKSQK